MVLNPGSSSQVVSQDAKRYIQTPADNRKLRFLAIDAVSGKTRESSFQEEIGRCARTRRTPPYHDPLSELPSEDATPPDISRALQAPQTE